MFNGRQRPKSAIIILCVMHRNRTSQLHGRTRLNQTASSAICTKKRRKTPLSNVSVFMYFYLADVLKISIVR